MELSILTSMVVWSFASYRIANVVKKNEGIELNPWLYVVGSLLLGFATTMCILWYKWAKAKEKNDIKIVAIVVGLLFFIVSFLI